MGAATFENLGIGADPNEVFRSVSEEVAYECGHGGYTGTIAEKDSFVQITSIPLVETEARALADRLIREGDQRVDDKWGPAGAIPVILETRTVQVGPFDYTVPEPSMSLDRSIEENLLEAVKPLVKLKAGEKIESIFLTSYATPSVPARGYYTSTASRRRTNCQARVTITKPPLVREVEFEVTLPNFMTPSFNDTLVIDYEKVQQELLKAASSNVRLKQDERIVDIRQVDSIAAKSKVIAEATKGKAITRYVVKGSVHHATWKNGFDSQAEARAWATKTAKESERDVRFEIEAVTRRETDLAIARDGLPLVVVAREVSERKHKVVAVVAKDAKAAHPEGWLFFGWASS